MREHVRFYWLLFIAIVALGGVSSGTETVCAAESPDGSVVLDETNFPDASFREYVRVKFDKNENGILEKEERELVSEMSVGGETAEGEDGFWGSRGTYSLQGLEHFKKVQRLEIHQVSRLSSQLPELPELEWLTLADGEGRPADVESWKQKLPLTQIKYLSLKNFRNGSLDLKSMGQLESFSLSVDSDREKDNMKRLDSEYYSGSIRLNDNKKLQVLELCNAKIKELDISANEQLTSLLLSDVSIKSKKLNILGKNKLESVTIQRAADLETLSVLKNRKLSWIKLQQLSGLKKLELSDNGSLKSLWLERLNQLGALDLAKNKRIEDVSLYNVNGLKKLNVKKNKALKTLTIHGKGPKKLDLSKNRQLRNLEILEQQIRFILPQKNRLRTLTVNASHTTIDLSSCVALRRIKTYSYGCGAKVKMKRTVFKRLWKSQKLKICDNYRNWYTVKNKKVKIPSKGEYVRVKI